MRVKQQYEDVVGRIKEAQTNQNIFYWSYEGTGTEHTDC